MNLFADKQTQEDLNLTGWHKGSSIARLFDVTRTAGGRRLMEAMFNNPLTDDRMINDRSSAFRYFAQHAIRFPFSSENLELLENYFRGGSKASLLEMGIQVTFKKIWQGFTGDEVYENLQNEVIKSLEFIRIFRHFVTDLPPCVDTAFFPMRERAMQILANCNLQWMEKKLIGESLSLLVLIKCHHLFQHILYNEINELLEIACYLDVFIAVAGLALERNFSYAKALPKRSNSLSVVGLSHPLLQNAIGNDLYLTGTHNIIFLTGANMAGKSTLMKAFGIGIYLAHMGFPVAATAMEFSVKDGLFTSINVPDNLNKGYSHFYAEVLRVKHVAQEVAKDKDLIVIFDELFKGTNVKDAHDATLAITSAFADNSNCFFLISTHIIEVGEALRQRSDRFQFAYLPTIMEGNKPRYTYQLREGITNDRQGMVIIENEKILQELYKGLPDL